MQENAEQNYSEYGHFSRSVQLYLKLTTAHAFQVFMTIILPGILVE